jgi:hypothetical protein
MLRCIFFTFFFISCTLGDQKSGGELKYLYQPEEEYNQNKLYDLSSKIVSTSFRNPPFGELEKLFGPGQKPLKKIALVVFESEIQPTRSGLSGENLIYLSEAGKQLLTEGMFRVWEDSLSLLSPEPILSSKRSIFESKSFRSYGTQEKDYILVRRQTLAPDDIFFLESGKIATTKTVMNPRGMQDFSLLLVPAYELMRGPKFSEHNKHFINDLSKELGLDAVLIVKSDLSWTRSHLDKHSGDSVSEAIYLNLESSILIPWHSYQERLERLGSKEMANVTVCYRSYHGKLKIPANFSYPTNVHTFEAFQRNLLLPMMKSYNDLTQMMIFRLLEDLKKTW